jgi:hypothetical protein
VWAYLRFRAMIWALRAALRVIRWLAVAAVLIAAAPLTLVTTVAVGTAWLRGWPPARLRRAAACALAMTLVWVAGLAAQAPGRWRVLATAPWHTWDTAWHDTQTGHLLAAAVLSAPLAVPAGLIIAAGLWAWRIYAIQAGLTGRAVSAPMIFDTRQWRRAARTAKARATAPGAVPLTDTRGRLVIGTTIRAVGHRWRPVLAVPYENLGRHQVIIGASGSGKTTLMMRLWAGWFTTAMQRYRTGRAARPLLAALDCKGGPDARAKAERARKLLHAAGAARVAIWPDEATLSLWVLPPGPLATTLFQMIESGEGAAAFYADVLAATVRLAINAPGGPPTSAAGFLDRLAPGWLETAYAGRPADLAAITAAQPHLGAIALRYRNLLERLGPGLDGPGQLHDADAWYFILEGTAEQSIAEAQAKALTELIAHAATSRTSPPRTILLALDDYSAVSGKVPLSNLYERGRSLGMGVQVSAQSWHGLGFDDAERYRIAATADGGIWLLRTPYPQPICELAGTRKIIESAHKLTGATWGDEGTSRLQYTWTVDPDIARSLAAGQAAYIHAGGCTWVHIARARPSPLALTPAPQPTPTPPDRPAPQPIALPGPPPAPPSPGDLDDAFTPRRHP